MLCESPRTPIELNALDWILSDSISDGDDGRFRRRLLAGAGRGLPVRTKNQSQAFLRLDYQTRKSMLQASEAGNEQLVYRRMEESPAWAKRTGFRAFNSRVAGKETPTCKEVETCQFEINDWLSLDRNSTGKGRLTHAKTLRRRDEREFDWQGSG
jgi:hypothetical protein